MTDVTRTVAPKTNQTNADDFIGGITRTITITAVKEGDSKEQPISISYEGDNGKPWKPSLGMRRVLIELWGQEAAKEADKHYRGRKVTLFRDPDVKFGKDTVGGIRISHVSDIKGDIKIALTVSKGRRVEFVVHPLKDEGPARVRTTNAPATTSAPVEHPTDIEPDQLYIMGSKGPTYFADFEAMRDWLLNAVPMIKTTTALDKLKENNQENFTRFRMILSEEWMDVIEEVITDREKELKNATT